MLDLDRYLRNPFDSDRISRDELVAYTADHLGKFATRNEGGAFDAEVTATAALFEALEGRLADETTAGAIRQARTAATGAKRDAIHDALSQLEGLVHARFPRGGADYIEIFPGGLEDLRKASLDGLNAKLVSLVARLRARAEVIGAADVERFATLQAEWAALRGEQVSRKGATADAAGDRRDAAAALRDQLFDNLLAIARVEKGKPEALRLYLTQGLLEDDARVADAGPVGV